MSTDFTTTITVNATPRHAYEAINNVSGWWGRITGSTASVGDEFVYVVPGVHYSGFRVVELVRAERIAWLVTGSYLDFVDDKQEWNGSTVRFEIREVDDRTEVVFTHEGLRPEGECYGACANAWSAYVRLSLKEFIESGIGRPNSFEGDEVLTAADHVELRDRIERSGARAAGAHPGRDTSTSAPAEMLHDAP